MASTLALLRDAFPANADLTGKERLFVKLNSSGKLALCGAGDGGFSLVNGGVAGENLTVDLIGESKITLGGTVASGALITSDANGKGVTATTGNFINGYVVQGGVSGDIVTFLAAVPTAKA
jgi:hypothetical protein